MQDPITQEPITQEPPVMSQPEKKQSEPLEQNPTTQPEKKQSEPNDLQIGSAQVQQVVDGITDLLHGRKISEALIIRVIANCMVITARMKVQNHLKKKIVIAALEKYIKERSDLSQDETDALMAIVDIVVADTIDTISDVKKGNIDLSTKTCCVLQ